MLGSRVVLGPIPGVARSAICQVLPTRTGGNVVVLDLGANAECTAEHLCQFAEMGTVFSRLTLGVDAPRVGLINIGEEVSKGTDTAKRVHRALSSVDGINFIGNVEPKALFNGETDVAVCDGFVGNIILKTLESSAALVKTMVENELRSSWISMVGAAISWGAFKRLRAKTDPNSRGGAPLLGVNGIVIIAHGSSTADGIKNALLNAREEYELGLNKHIQTGIAEFRVDIAPLRPEAAQS
jgi:glycerol-3-phosphate acyltransferase PlsX